MSVQIVNYLEKIMLKATSEEIQSEPIAITSTGIGVKKIANPSLIILNENIYNEN